MSTAAESARPATSYDSGSRLRLQGPANAEVLDAGPETPSDQTSSPESLSSTSTCVSTSSNTFDIEVTDPNPEPIDYATMRQALKSSSARPHTYNAAGPIFSRLDKLEASTHDLKAQTAQVGADLNAIQEQMDKDIREAEEEQREIREGIDDLERRLDVLEIGFGRMDRWNHPFGLVEHDIEEIDTSDEVISDSEDEAVAQVPDEEEIEESDKSTDDEL
jgi:vacuolar-type H+-ATPase subunit I/STV1